MKKLLHIWMWTLAFLLFTPTVYAAGVENITVEAKGSAATREEAIKLALVEALSQVRGIDVSSSAASKQKISIASKEEESGEKLSGSIEINIAEAVQQNISTATSGHVERYSVISEEASTATEGFIDVILSVVIARYKDSVQTQRQRIAVLPFRIQKNTREFAEFADLLARETINYISQTRRFALLDRDYLAEKHSEFNLLQGGDAKPAERARIGNTLGTDFIIAGTLLSIHNSVETKKVPYMNEMSSIMKVQAALSWRIVEVATGQIVFSKTTEFSSSTKKIPDDGQWMRPPAVIMGKEIASTLMDIIYPLMPVSYKNGRLLIPQGGETVEMGQRYTFIKYGDVVYSPYTKEAVAREELHVGLVEIVQVTPKISYAKVIETTLDEKELQALAERQYILRPLEKGSAKGKAKKPAPVKTQTPNW